MMAVEVMILIVIMKKTMQWKLWSWIKSNVCSWNNLFLFKTCKNEAFVLAFLMICDHFFYPKKDTFFCHVQIGTLFHLHLKDVILITDTIYCSQKLIKDSVEYLWWSFLRKGNPWLIRTIQAIYPTRKTFFGDLNTLH